MVIFHSYVSLPEGMCFHLFKINVCRTCRPVTSPRWSSPWRAAASLDFERFLSRERTERQGKSMKFHYEWGVLTEKSSINR